jgi:hypothetical protein
MGGLIWETHCPVESTQPCQSRFGCSFYWPFAPLSLAVSIGLAEVCDMHTLRIEPLESHRLMAVTANLNNGTLEIRAADTIANNLAIAGTGVAGEVAITGRNGTTVNGLSAVTFQGVTGALDFNVSNTSVNRVSVDNLYVAGFVHVGLNGFMNSVVIGANGPVSSGQFMWVVPIINSRF